MPKIPVHALDVMRALFEQDYYRPIQRCGAGLRWLREHEYAIDKDWGGRPALSVRGDALARKIQWDRMDPCEDTKRENRDLRALLREVTFYPTNRDLDTRIDSMLKGERGKV